MSQIASAWEIHQPNWRKLRPWGSRSDISTSRRVNVGAAILSAIRFGTEPPCRQRGEERSVCLEHLVRPDVDGSHPPRRGDGTARHECMRIQRALEEHQLDV